MFCHFRLCSLFLLAAVLVRVALAAEPVRVVSQTVGTDELLLAIAAPEQIAALSHLARDAEFSAVAAEAAPFPQLPRAGDAESVLAHAPTLVLVADYTREELRSQLQRAGVKLLVLDRYESLDDVFAFLHELARELGPAAEARARNLETASRARVAALAERLRDVKPVRVIAPSTYGVISGSGTTFQDLCDHAAAENLAATLGGLHGHASPPLERMLTWPVEFVVVAGDNRDAALAPYRELSPYRFMPAVKEGRAVVLRPWMLGCVSHRRIDAYETLARALHPEVFR